MGSDQQASEGCLIIAVLIDRAGLDNGWLRRESLR
jgi:hypothetical protein